MAMSQYFLVTGSKRMEASPRSMSRVMTLLAEPFGKEPSGLRKFGTSMPRRGFVQVVPPSELKFSPRSMPVSGEVVLPSVPLPRSPLP